MPGIKDEILISEVGGWGRGGGGFGCGGGGGGGECF